MVDDDDDEDDEKVIPKTASGGRGQKCKNGRTELEKPEHKNHCK